MGKMIKLLKLEAQDLHQFKLDMQEAFQLGAAAEFTDLNVEILPEADIKCSLEKRGLKA